MKVEVISSIGIGIKSKKTKGNLYVCCDRGTKLANTHSTMTKKGPVYSLKEFEQNMPMDKIEELIKFCKDKKIETLQIGVSSYPHHSHAYLIAEAILPTGEAFGLPLQATPVRDREFKNQRDFERWLKMTNWSSAKYYRARFREYLLAHDLEDLIGIPEEDKK